MNVKKFMHHSHFWLHARTQYELVFEQLLSEGKLRSSSWSLSKAGFLLTLTYTVQLTFPTYCRGSLHKYISEEPDAAAANVSFLVSFFSFPLVSSLLDPHFVIFSLRFVLVWEFFLISAWDELGFALLVTSNCKFLDSTRSNISVTLSSFWRLWAWGRIVY
jgi:hypothetical protein